MAKRLTFKQAKARILAALKTEGWKVVDHLKVPHATTPNGEARIWFKPQALHSGPASKPAGWARSMDPMGTMIDPRDLAQHDPAVIAGYLERNAISDARFTLDLKKDD